MPLHFYSLSLPLFVSVSLILGCTDRSPKVIRQNIPNQYLQNYADHPVHWHPWGAEALQKAKDQDRLIFLNIGYSSCAPCTTVNEQALKSERVSPFLNKNFVNIVADRAEHPDVNAYFINLQTLIMNFGGWPINIILTPDLQPVFVTTFSDEAQFLEVLKKSHQAWTSDRKKLLRELKIFSKNIQPQDKTHEASALDIDLLDDFYARWTHQFDTVFGGRKMTRGPTPKFPTFQDFRVLLYFAAQTKNQQARQMVKKTTSTVSKSALFDHLGGGFFNHSKSNDWNTPQLEKNLVDQATALHAFVDFYRLQPSDSNKRVIDKIAKSLFNSFANPRGGFYNRLGSDDTQQSIAHYTWTQKQLKESLTDAELKIFFEAYTLHRPAPSFIPKPVLRRKTVFPVKGLAAIEKKLFDLRQSGRPLTHDPVIVTADTSYALAALAKILRLWPDQKLKSSIDRHLNFILSQHRHFNGELYHSSYQGHVQNPGTLDDYAFTVDALLEMYQTTFEKHYLQTARSLNDRQYELFYNQDKKLYRFSQSPLLPEQFLFSDRRLPNSQAITFWNLMRLGRLTDHSPYVTQAYSLLQGFPESVLLNSLPYSTLLIGIAMDQANEGVQKIVGSQQECQKKISEFYQFFSLKILFKCQSH